MPGNLEFISPPFLISAPVIQINSNEISRGKAPFGWGVCSSPQLSTIQRPFPPERRPSNPPLPVCPYFFNMWKNESEALSLTDTESLNSSHGLWGFSSNSWISTQDLFAQRASDQTSEAEIRWRQSLTNGRTAGDLILFTACLWWIIGVVLSADPGSRSYIWSNWWPK